MSKPNSPAITQRGRDPKKESHWRERLSHQTRGGLTVRAFCEREALKESAFYFWRREIRRRDRQAVGRRTPALAFVEVHAAPVSAAVAAVEREAPLELVFPDDRRLLIRGGCDAAWLARVLAVLAPVSLSNREARPC